MPCPGASLEGAGHAAVRQPPRWRPGERRWRAVASRDGANERAEARGTGRRPLRRGTGTTATTPAPTAARAPPFIARYFKRARPLAAARVTTAALPGQSPAAPPSSEWLRACAGPLGKARGGEGCPALAAGRGRERWSSAGTAARIPLRQLPAAGDAPSQPHLVGEEDCGFLPCGTWRRHGSSLPRGPVAPPARQLPAADGGGVRAGSRGDWPRAAAAGGGAPYRGRVEGSSLPSWNCQGSAGRGQ